MTKRISLSTRLAALVDDADYDLLKKVPWFCNGGGYVVGFVPSRDGFKLVSMHRFLLNALEGQQVDHIDGNRLNNVRSNLRLATPQQNCLNKRVSHASTTNLKGVHWHKGRSKYEARIQHQGMRCHLGFFTDPEMAALAYDEAVWHLFGEFGWCNYPDRPTPQPVALLVAERLRKRGLIS